VFSLPEGRAGRLKAAPTIAKEPIVRRRT
jgi:hypothetical protein